MKNYILCLWLTAACFTKLLAHGNPIKADSTATQNFDEVLVKAVLEKSNAQIARYNVSKKDTKKCNLGQDIPTLLNYLPSLVAKMMPLDKTLPQLTTKINNKNIVT